MRRALYVTFDTLDPNNGAGLVCMHEVNALKKVVDDVFVIQRNTITGADLYEFNPFLYDYFAAQVAPGGMFDIVHLSCSPAIAILDRVRTHHYTVNIVAHDLQVSIDEHELYYGKGSYPFKHNTNEYLHKLLLKHADDADCIFTPSSTSKEWIDKNIPSRKNVRIISHGTEIPEEFGIFPDHFTLGYLGAFGPDKGLIYLFEAWKQCHQGELLLGGNCHNVLLPVLQANPNAYPETSLLGWVDHVSQFYNQITAYVQPSVTEGFGIEILEAMAYGKPVIASRGAGGADVITDCVDGFVVPARDVSAIVDKVRFFMDNPEKAKEMGIAARETAKKYSWDKIEDKYISTYKEILNG
jgi:glycosyltransferase involved in cell wall biosynthesis